MGRGLYFSSGIDQGYERDIERMMARTNQLGRNTQRQGAIINSTFANIARTIGGTVSVLAVGAAGKELVTFTKDLETALTEVSTISTEVSNNFSQYEDSILALSSTSATGAVALTEAFYDIVSAGYDGQQGLELLVAAEEAATAGFVEVGTAADGLTTVLNAWGKSASEAGNVSDVFFKTVEKGKTTFPELGSNIAQVAPIAASLGVSFEEISGAMATLTKSGTPTSQAFTQIRSSLLSVNDVLGDGWAQTMTYQEALLAVREQAGGSTNKLKEMLGRVEAVNAVLGLTGDNASIAASDLEAMNNALGATVIAAEKVRKSTDQQISILKNNILAAFQPLSEKLVGVVAKLAESLNEAFKSGDIQKYAAIVGKLIKVFAAYKLSIVALNQVRRIQRSLILNNVTAMRLSAQTGRTVSASNLLMARSMKTLKAAFATNPIGLLVTALTLAIPLIKNVVDSLESAEHKLKAIDKEIDKTFASESSGLKVLQDQLNDSNITYDEKKKLINQLNTEYGEYLPHLLTEKSSQEDINKAIAQANVNLKEQIRLRVLNQKAVEAQETIYELEKKLEKSAEGFIAKSADYYSKSLNIAGVSLATALQTRQNLLKKNLEEEQKAYDAILQQIVDSSSKAVDEIPPIVPPDITEEARKKAIKAIEITYQERINLLKKQLADEQIIQDQFDEESLKSQLQYLQALKKLTVDELERLRIDEQILDVSSILDINKEKEQLKDFLEQFRTYTEQRTSIEEDYNEKITVLRKNGYEAQAQEAEIALQKELDRLDASVVKGSEVFQAWAKDTLPELAKEGVAAIEKELANIELKISAEGLNPKSMVVLQAQIKKLKEALKKAQKAQEDNNNSWKDTLELMNGLNTLLDSVRNSFDDVSGSTGAVIEGITASVTGVINLVTAVKAASAAMNTLEKASAILAAIGAAFQVIQAIAKAAKEVQEIKLDNQVKEIEYIQSINALLIEQNLLYEEGNQLFSQDQWGTALKGLEAYNQALEAQQVYVEELIASQGRQADATGLLGGTVGDQFKQQELDFIRTAAILTGGTELEKALGSVLIKTKERTKAGKFFLGVQDEFDSLLKKYPELIQANGDLDVELLKVIADSENLGKADKARLQSIIEVTEQAQQAYAQFGDYISSIFGSVGDEVTQAFQQMYESGDSAMLALEESFSNMVENFTRQAIEFAFLQPYLNELNKTTKELGEQYAAGDISAEALQENIISSLGDFYGSLNELQPEILKAYENADKLAAEAGFEKAFNTDEEEPISTLEVDSMDVSDQEADVSRAGQISQAITEETGSELVGRLGAIMLSNERIANHGQEMLDYAIQNLVQLNLIKQNTDYLPEIAENTRKTFESLESI